ncbi:MAG: Chromosome partition protein Smc [Calditrichaeota bacterium]|nr:Chromosome partition protein Smc [Calditrichota bacterium]
MIARLQAVDDELMDLELEKGDLPKQIDAINSEISRLETRKTELDDQLGEVEKKKRVNEGSIELHKVKLDKYQNQLYSVTTNREYDAINQEIETCRAQIESVDNAQVSLLEEEEEIQGQIEPIDVRIDALQADLAEREEELKSKHADTETEELELQHDREKLIVRIKKPVVAHYERIRASRNGTGAARMYGGACGACFAVIPPQRQAEVRKLDDIILCESCGVIVLPEEEHMPAIAPDEI